jgi:hypothetical protein
MRENLRDTEGHRAIYTATFQRFGQKTWRGYVTITLLFVNIISESGAEVCDHLWFRSTKGFEKLNLQPGDRIQFRATSRPYTKGYRGCRDLDDAPALSTDYRLSHPAEICILTPQNETPPLFTDGH